MAQNTLPDPQTLALLRSLISALEDKKAEKLKVLQVGGVSDITDFLVLATGNSEPHLRALRIEAEKILDAAGARIAGMDSGGFNSGWTVVDAYQIMIHFFTAEQRENYALEKLWRDAPELDRDALEGKVTAKAVKTPRAKKTPTAKPKTASKTKVTSKTTRKAPAPKKAPRSESGKDAPRGSASPVRASAKTTKGKKGRAT
jgi:ribosome-associated protein